MQGTVQSYVLDMAASENKIPMHVKQSDTNSRQARITLKAFGEPWTIPFASQIHIVVAKSDGTQAMEQCVRVDENTVLAPISEQMTAIPGTQRAELYFVGSDGDIKSQTFPIIVHPAVMDRDRVESSDDFNALRAALQDVKTSTVNADRATQESVAQTALSEQATDRANTAAESLQVAVDASAAAKVSETNAKTSETAAAQTQQEVTDYVESQKAAFVGYSKRESDSKYANALTNSATGEGGATVEDAWTAPVLGLDVAGKSEQVVTTGAQLYNTEMFADVSTNGIHYVNNHDGSISVTGTSTAIASAYQMTCNLAPGPYYISGSQGDAGVYVQDINGTTNYYNNQGFSIVDGDKVTAYLQVGAGKTVNAKVWPMLNAGDTALPFEPYTGGAPPPSPDYPQDIISTGTVSTGGQLLKESYVTKSINGLAFTVNNDESFSIAGTATASTSINLIDDGSLIQSCFSRGGKYYFSLLNANYNASTCNISIKYADGSTETKFFLPKGMKELPPNAEFRGCTLWINSGVTINLSHVKLMLNAGDTARPWEPYTGGKPAPSVEYPQTLEVQATGANLLQVNPQSETNGGVNFVVQDGEITLNGTASEDRGIFLLGNSFTGDKTCLTLKDGSYSAGGYPKNTRLFLYRVGNTASAFVVTSGSTFKIGNDPGAHTGNDLVSVSLRWEKGAVFNNEKFRIMFNAGTTLLPWEPYRSSTAPITLTEPLRGIGDYRDRIMCKDGVWGIERWLYRVDYDGSEDEAWTIQSVNDKGITNYMISLKVIANKNLNGLLCSRLCFDNVFIADAIHDGVLIGGGFTLYIRLKEVKALDDFRKWLTENPLIIMYPLATPTWTPLPDATQQALNALTTYAGTTHLTITAGGTTPTVTLDYVQDTHKAFEQHDAAVKQYVDSQIAAIVAALPTATQAAIADNQTTRLLQEV